MEFTTLCAPYNKPCQDATRHDPSEHDPSEHDPGEHDPGEHNPKSLDLGKGEQAVNNHGLKHVNKFQLPRHFLSFPQPPDSI